MKQKPVVASLLIWTAAMLTTACLAQNPTDAEIQSAIDRGKVTPSKKLWESIKKKQEFRINRAGLDPIEKKVLILADADRIALEASEAKRQLREISVEEIKQHLPLGLTEVLLEANCYNNTYAGSLPKWGPNGGVHVVLKIDGKIIQPIEKSDVRVKSLMEIGPAKLRPSRSCTSGTRRQEATAKLHSN